MTHKIDDREMRQRGRNTCEYVLIGSAVVRYRKKGEKWKRYNDIRALGI